MIIRRYLANQLLASALAVTGLLAFILLGGRIIKYFGMAAQGKLDVELLSAVILYRLPGFLELIAPLGLFIAVLLVLGRLYIDNEMAVLAASGASPLQLMGHAAPAIAVMTLLVGVLSLGLTPYGNRASERIFAEQARRNTFDLIKPGQFQQVNGRMLYAEGISADKTRLLGVLMYEERPDAQGQAQKVLVRANMARRYQDPVNGQPYIELLQGNRYELMPGTLRYSRLHFDSYRMRLKDSGGGMEITRARTLSTPTIRRKAADGDPLAIGEWMWRISLPLLTPIAALIAFPMARVNPRQGRFIKLLPAILFYISYVVLIAAARNAIDKGKAGPVAVWGVHVFFLLLAAVLLGWDGLQVRWRAWRAAGRAAA